MEYAHAMGHGYGFGLGFLNFLGTVLFFITVVWLFRAFLGRRGRYRPPFGSRGWSRWDGYRDNGGEDSALRTAKERFAQGKINAEEFETIRNGLGGDENDKRGGPGFPDFSNLGGNLGSSWGRERALDIARTRFAKGEITQKEFETVKRTLET